MELVLDFCRFCIKAFFMFLDVIGVFLNDF